LKWNCCRFLDLSLSPKIPERWLQRVKETDWTLDKVRQIAHKLHKFGQTRKFKLK
jgi:hypothetical protein